MLINVMLIVRKTCMFSRKKRGEETTINAQSESKLI